MSNAEQKLAQLFAADVPPPPSGRAFAFAVLERIERRRIWAEVVDGMFLAAAACALLWVLAPVIERLAESVIGVVNAPAFMAVIVLTATALAYIGMGRWREIWEL